MTSSFAQRAIVGATEESLEVGQSSMRFQQIDFDSFDTGGLSSSKRVPIKGYLLLANRPELAPGAVFNPACEGL
jgi:hypothetical protein